MVEHNSKAAESFLLLFYLTTAVYVVAISRELYTFAFEENSLFDSTKICLPINRYRFV